MKRFIFIAALLLIGSNVLALEDWVNLRDYTVEFPFFVSGTYTEGANQTEPQPLESKYLQVEQAGMLVLKKGVGFFLNVKIKERPKTQYYITVQYPNPLDPTNPLTNDVPFSPLHEYLKLSSPDLIKGLDGYEDYEITLHVYKDEKSMELIDTLTQPVRCYLDTREARVRIFRKVIESIK